MKRWFRPNIGTTGRWVRGGIAVACVVGAVAGYAVSPWLAVLLGASALFVAFEAALGWCALRACGVKTRF